MFIETNQLPAVDTDSSVGYPAVPSHHGAFV
jgi:hypothetical protein